MSNDSVVLGTITCLWWANKISNNPTASTTENHAEIVQSTTADSRSAAQTSGNGRKDGCRRVEISLVELSKSLWINHSLELSLSAMTRFEDAFWVR